MVNTLGIKHKEYQFFSEHIRSKDHENLIITLPESKKNLFYSKLNFYFSNMLSFDKLDEFVTFNGGFIQEK